MLQINNLPSENVNISTTPVRQEDVIQQTVYINQHRMDLRFAAMRHDI